MTKYEGYINEIEDFPSTGIRFYDISPLIGDGEVFGSLIKYMAEPYHGRVDRVVGLDARGFLFAGAIAVEIGCGMSMLRKEGKLPGKVFGSSYDLEYGRNTIEIQSDSVKDNERVLLVDDVIATGGTALAGINLVRQCGGEVIEFCTVIDLEELGGSKQIEETGVSVNAVIRK